MSIQNNKKARIHILKNALGLDDQTYRDTLWFAFHKTSSSELTPSEAEEIIRVFEDWVKEKGITSQIRKKKFDDLEGRPGMATPRQLRMIDAMWKGISREDSSQAKEKALRIFIERRFGISDLRFIEDWQVPKIIEALNAMKTGVRKNKEKNRV